MSRPRNPKIRPRDWMVAAGILRGDSNPKACLYAGYSKSYAHSFASKVCASPGVLRALSILRGYIPQEKLGNIATAKLYAGLVKPPKNPKVALAYTRTALEVAGMLHPKEQQSMPMTLSPAVQKMLEDQMGRIAKEPKVPPEPPRITTEPEPAQIASKANNEPDEDPLIKRYKARYEPTRATEQLKPCPHGLFYHPGCNDAEFLK